MVFVRNSESAAEVEVKLVVRYAVGEDLSGSLLVHHFGEMRAPFRVRAQDVQAPVVIVVVQLVQLPPLVRRLDSPPSVWPLS